MAELSERFVQSFCDAGCARRSRGAMLRANAFGLVRRELIAARADSVPTDLRKIARHLGVVAVESVPLAMRGRLLQDNGVLRIEVNEALSSWMQRFTVAHEIAHIVIEKSRVFEATNSGRDSGRTQSFGLIEKLCDECAEEILLPANWLASTSRDFKATHDFIDNVSRVAIVPARFAIDRVIRLGLRPWRRLEIKRAGKAYAVVNSYPTWDDAFMAGIEVVGDPTVEFTQSGGSVRNRRGRLVLKIQDQVTTYTAEILDCVEDSMTYVLSTGG